MILVQGSLKLGNVSRGIKMRRLIVLGVVGGLGALALAGCQKKSETAATGDGAPAAAAAPAAPMGPPKRKLGLWSNTMTTAGVNQTVKMCLDADSEAKMAGWGEQGGSAQCSKPSFTPTPGGMAFESTCDMGANGKTVTKGVVTGDFNSKYTMKLTATTTGAAAPQANGVHEMTMDAAWEGPCPAGMAGGDININGMVINPAKMAAGTK